MVKVNNFTYVKDSEKDWQIHDVLLSEHTNIYNALPMQEAIDTLVKGGAQVISQTTSNAILIKDEQFYDVYVVSYLGD